jgi:hypothetical protein
LLTTSQGQQKEIDMCCIASLTNHMEKSSSNLSIPGSTAYHGGDAQVEFNDLAMDLAMQLNEFHWDIE